MARFTWSGLVVFFLISSCQTEVLYRDIVREVEIIREAPYKDFTIRGYSNEIIENEDFHELLPNFGIDFDDKESFIRHSLPQLLHSKLYDPINPRSAIDLLDNNSFGSTNSTEVGMKKVYDSQDDVNKLIENGNVNFIFKFSTFPIYNISIPIKWTGFSESYQLDNSWQFYYQSLDWLSYYTSEINDRYPNQTLDLKVKHAVGGYVLKDYANNALNSSLKYGWSDHAIARRADRTREFLEDYISYNDSLNIDILYPALKIAYSHYLRLMLQDHYPSLPHNHGLMMDVALYKAANYFNFMYKEEALKISNDRIEWQITNSVSSKGVHFEHSPGYQTFYLKILIDVVNSFADSDIEVPEFLISAVDNMIMAIPYLLQPNITFPQFGDTPNSRVDISSMIEDYIDLNQTGTDLSNILEFFKNTGSSHGGFQNTKVFDEAGYAAFRSAWSSNEPENDVMAHFSCNFFSWTHYHRSENSFELYGYGTEIITDAGHHNFNNKDPHTYFSKQAYAHNVLLINNQNYKPHVKHFGKSKIVDFKVEDSGFSWVKGYHPQFWNYLRTEVYRYFGMDDQSLVYLKDSLTSPDTTYTYQQLFTLRPEFHNVERLNNDLILVSSNNKDYPGLILYPVNSNFHLSVKNGIQEGQMMGWYFEGRNVKSPTNTIVLDYAELGTTVELPVMMEVISPQELTSVKVNQDRYLEKYSSRIGYLSFTK